MTTTTDQTVPTTPTTTEFWKSEDDFDVAQIMVKRITYTIYKWLYRLMVAEGIMAVGTFLLVLPAAVTLWLMNRSIRRVIERRRKYWENDEKLMEELYRKVDEQLQELSMKQEQARVQAMMRAVADVKNLTRGLQGYNIVQEQKLKQEAAAKKREEAEQQAQLAYEKEIRGLPEVSGISD